MTTYSKARKALDMTPGQMFGARAVAGEVGIEIECEGNNLAKRISKYWTTHADGSLRGESIEYVLNGPISREAVGDALKVLNDELKARGSVVNESYRTSVHVHLNAQTMKIRTVFNQLILYMLFEDLLVEYCGKDRVGNLFCLRAQDAENLIQVLSDALKSGNYGYFNGDHLRYAAVNVNALSKYGSLEFRAFRGTTDPKAIAEWVSILLKIKDAAAEYDNPTEICRDFSVVGPKAFMNKVFGPEISAVLNQYKDVEKRLMGGVRMVQDIAFAIDDWSPWKPTEKEVEFNGYGGLAKPKVVRHAEALGDPDAFRIAGDEMAIRAAEVPRGRAEVAPAAGMQWRFDVPPDDDFPEPEFDDDDDDDHDEPEQDEEEEF